MARPRIMTTPLAKYRMNKGWTTEEIAAQAGMSEATVLRLEKGAAISRVFAAKYFRVLGVDLTTPATFPAGVEVIDLEEKIKIHSTLQQ